MIITILSQQWKAFWRSRNVGKSVAMQILVGFMILYLLGSCLVLGIMLPGILRNVFPGQDVTRVFCGLLLYYYIFDLAFRYFIQELPVLAVQPYLALNIRRRKLVAFLNIRSLFHFANLLPIILFFPFIIGTLAPASGMLIAAVFAASLLLLTTANHFLLLYIKRQTVLNSWWLLGFCLGLVALAGLDSLGWLPVRRISAAVFTRLLAQPGWVLVPAVLFALTFSLNRRFLLGHLYLEDLSAGRKIRRSTDYSWLRQLGTKGELMSLDLKLIFRNKKPRYAFFMSFVVLVYGLVAFQHGFLQPDRMVVTAFGALFITGAFILNYGQWIFSWQSIHFDGLLSANVDLATYIRGKLLLFTIVSAFQFIVSTAYGLLDRHLVYILTAAWLYNIGFNSVLTIWLGTFRYKGVDLSAGNMSFQGLSASTLVNVLLVMVAPILLVELFSFLGLSWTGIIIIGAIGLVSLLLRNWWVGFLVGQFNTRKYLILQGFREAK